MTKTGKTLLIIGGTTVGVLLIYKVFQMTTANKVAVIRTQTLAAASPGTVVAPPSPLSSLIASIFPSTAKPAVAVDSGGIQMSQGALTSPTGTPTNFVQVTAIHQLI